MRLDIAVLAALVAPALADSLTIRTSCNSVGVCNSGGVWHASNANYGDLVNNKLNLNGGCRSLPIPAFQQVCFDWNNRRAHFYFNGQNKRCLKEASVNQYHCAGGDRCWEHRWNEVPCTW